MIQLITTGLCDIVFFKGSTTSLSEQYSPKQTHFVSVVQCDAQALYATILFNDKHQGAGTHPGFNALGVGMCSGAGHLPSL